MTRYTDVDAYEGIIPEDVKEASAEVAALVRGESRSDDSNHLDGRFGGAGLPACRRAPAGIYTNTAGA